MSICLNRKTNFGVDNCDGKDVIDAEVFVFNITSKLRASLTCTNEVDFHVRANYVNPGKSRPTETSLY